MRIKNKYKYLFVIPKRVLYLLQIKSIVMEKLEAYKSLVVYLPLEFNYKIDLYIAEQKRNGVRKTKSELIAKFAQIGFLTENK